MADTLYIMHAVDSWDGPKYIYGAYSSREKAIANLLANNSDLVYDERFERWKHPDPDNTEYFYIEEIHVN